MEPETTTEQAPAASVQDRIANIFGDGAQEEPAQPAQEQAASEPATEPTGEEAAAPAEETFEVEIDGEKFTLPKKLEKGFMQERDYTQKSQTLAEQKRNAEFILAQQSLARMSDAFKADTAQEHQQLDALNWAIQQPVDWASMSTDEAFRKKLQLDQWKDEAARIEKMLGTKRDEFGKKTQAEIEKLRAQSVETLRKRIPGWSDETAKAVRQYALDKGLTETEVGSILDPRHIEILHDAQQYRKLQSTAQKTVQSAKNVKTTPSNPMPQQVKDKLAFRKEVSRHPVGSHQQQKLVKDRIAKIFG